MFSKSAEKLFKNYCRADSSSVADLLICWLSEVVLKWDSLDSYVPYLSQAITSEIHKLWGSFFFSKCSKSNVDFRNAVKNWEKSCQFLDNCIWVGCRTFSLLPREYLSLRVNKLKNGLKISDITKKDFL